MIGASRPALQGIHLRRPTETNCGKVLLSRGRLIGGSRDAPSRSASAAVRARVSPSRRETVGEAMAGAVARWWHARYANAPVPSMNVVSKVLLDAGLQKAKRNGRMTYSAAVAAPSMH